MSPSASPAGSLRVEGIYKRFASRRGVPVAAVQGVSFQVQPGEIMGLLGPSGSGKTTILRLIAGLEVPDAGKIHLGGAEIQNTAPARREIGMTLQEPTALPHLTVRENLDLGLRFQRTSRAVRAERLSKVAERLGIFGLLDRMPHELSVGQRQRVSLGRALVGRPRALLFDEPCHCLDPERRADLREEIRRVAQWADIPAILVTHDPYEAFWLADTIGLLIAGELVQYGPAATVYSQPDTLDCAALLSPWGLNRLPGTINTDPSPAIFTSDCGRVAFPIHRLEDRNAAPFAKGTPVVFVARPNEALIVDPPQDPSAYFSGEVLDCKNRGPFHSLRLRVGAQEWALIDGRSRVTPSPGAIVSLDFTPQTTAFYRREDGARAPFQLESSGQKRPH